MPHHWQSNTVKSAGVDDMTLLSKVDDHAITDNLMKRFKSKQIYTYIGYVLIAVNPFEMIPIYDKEHWQRYQGSVFYEVPPHVYALGEEMYRNMMVDKDNHCVIISGESGAGKTVSAKHIMHYVSLTSGSGSRAQYVKDVILQSNPLLEAFGNAKTVRNNNSSRFGKYVEIQFNEGGQPVGGFISNFLLEKSRVACQNKNERSFHIFYQLCNSKDSSLNENLGLCAPENFHYLNQSGVYMADGIDDRQEFQETLNAMRVMGMSEQQQQEVLQTVAAILHLGSVRFVEEGNYARVVDKDALDWPAALLGIDKTELNEKLLSRVMETQWGGRSESVQITHNVEQACHTRDAWSKALYSRLFDYLVQTVNSAMKASGFKLIIGILDIYGFEIFENNGFEQFCINYVNEKLQQIFIELTLKAEQEEYKVEGIQWKPVEFFDNRMVCEMIEARQPPGVFCILDDICAKSHAVSGQSDRDFQQQLDKAMGLHKNYERFAQGFTVLHYAGKVSYNVDGFCERNRDVLFSDIFPVMQSSQFELIRQLFPDEAPTGTAKARPTTAGTKIRQQAKALTEKLTACTPQYIRCIKPNETKKPGDWNGEQVCFQVTYLGLKENIRVRRAGFAYRRPFEKFLQRYNILSEETWPHWSGDPRQGITHVMEKCNLEAGDHYHIGRTKIFVRQPETLFLLEDLRERKYNFYAQKIQKFFRRVYAAKQRTKQRQEGCELFLGRKERRRFSINRAFCGDYIGLDNKTDLLALLGRREKVLFAETIRKYDRLYRRHMRDLIVTSKFIYLISWEKVKNAANKGDFEPVIKRKLAIESVDNITVSELQDDMVVLFIKDDFPSVFEICFKTEFLVALKKLCAQSACASFVLNFSQRIEYSVKGQGWRGGGTRTIQFKSSGESSEAVRKISGKTLTVTIAPGLDKNTKPAVCADMGRVRSTRAKAGANSANIQKTNWTPPNTGSYGAPSLASGSASASTASASSFQSDNLDDSVVSPALPRVVRKSAPPRPSIPVKPKAKPRYRALYGYDACDVDELTLMPGDIVDVVNKDASGWWLGSLNGEKGLFPGNYVEEIS